MKTASRAGGCLLLIALSNLVLADGYFVVTSQDGNGRNGEVTKYDAATGGFLDVIIGPLADYRFRGATVGPDGLLYLSVLNDRSDADSRILRYDLDGNFIDEFVSAGSRGDGKLGNPDGLGVASPLRFGPDGNLYVIANSGIVDEIISFDGKTGEYLGPVINSIVSPTEFVFGADGLLYVSVSAQNPIPSSIQRFDIDTGQRIDVFVPSGSGGLVVPNSIAFGADGDLYAASFAEKAVFRYDGDTGAFIERFANISDLGDPTYGGAFGIVFGPDGRLYVDVRFLGLGGAVRFDENSGEYLERFIEPGLGGLRLQRGKDMLFVDTGCSRYTDGGLRNRCFVPVVTTVEMDIKPGEIPNDIKPSGKQNISVAVLSTASFDASQVDWETVSFGPDGATESHGRAHIEDVDLDGFMDMVLHFNTQDTGIACGDTEATLTGETSGGEAVRGSDSIVTVNCD